MTSIWCEWCQLAVLPVDHVSVVGHILCDISIINCYQHPIVWTFNCYWLATSQGQIKTDDLDVFERPWIFVWSWGVRVFVVQVQQSMVAKVLFVGVDCISFICWSGQLATTSILFCFLFSLTILHLFWLEKNIIN